MPEHSTSSCFRVIAAGETDRGRKRDHNEDAILVRADMGLYVVADGAGGHNAGNVASALATTTVAKHLEQSSPALDGQPELDAFGLWTAARALAAAVQKANAAVIEVARTANKYRGMGTTIVCALFAPGSGRVHIAHVGDSRCYRLRHELLEPLTQDHSLLNDVVEARPDLSAEALARLPRKAVTRALGLEESLRVSVRTLRAMPGDRYLLCTDGMTGELSEPSLQEILGSPGRPEEIVRQLVDAANAAGGRDNIGAVVIELRPAGAGDAEAPRAAARSPGRREPPKLPDRTAGTVPKARSAAGAAGAPPRQQTDPEIEITGEMRASDPEILLIRTADGAHDDRDSEITMVPAQSGSEPLRLELDELAPALGTRTVRCERCSRLFEGDGLYCPHCGATQGGPVTRG